MTKRPIGLLSLAGLLLACGAPEATTLDEVGKADGAATGIVFPSNAHRARQLFMFGNMYTSDVVAQVSAVVDQIHQGPAAVMTRLLVNEDPSFALEPGEEASLGYTRGDNTAPKLALAYAHSGIKPEMWIQDQGQFYYAGDTPAFLDVNYDAPAPAEAEFYRYIADPQGLTGLVNNDLQAQRTEATIDNTLEGGDLEALPDGKLLVGNLIHPGLEAYLQGALGQQIVRVPAAFIATGHVDEVFSIVPAPRASTNGCGYALVHIDPLYGLRLALDRDLSHAQADERQQYIDAISYYNGEDGETLIHRDHFQSIPAKYVDRDLEIISEPFGKSPNYAQWYVARAVEIHNQVQQGISIIKAALAGSCADLKTVGLPVLFSDVAAQESTLMQVSYDETTSDSKLSDLFKAAPVNMHYSPVNMLVLNEHLLMPVPEGLGLYGWSAGFTESFRGTFEWIVRARLQKVGIPAEHTHFIRANALIHNGGSLHCGTNTLRYKSKLVY